MTKHVIKEEISSCLILGDLDRFDGLVQVVHMYLDHKLMEAFRNKGLQKDITALADKAGQIK